MPSPFTCRADPSLGWTQCQFDSAADIVHSLSPQPTTNWFPRTWSYYNDALPSSPDIMRIHLYHQGYFFFGNERTFGGFASGRRNLHLSVNRSSGPIQSSDPVKSVEGAIGVETGSVHELGHNIYSQLNGLSTGGWQHEFFANTAEYTGGTRYVGGPSGGHSYDYDISIAPNDSANCADPTEYCPGAGRPYGSIGSSVNCKYDEFSLFGVYLASPFYGGLSQESHLDDLKRGWARAKVAGNSTQCDFWGLRTALDDANLPADLTLHYTVKFGTTDPDLRVNRLFNWYGIARYVNNPDPGFYDGRYGFPSNITSYTNFPLFRDTAPLNNRRAGVHPPELVLGAAFLGSGADSLFGLWYDPVQPTSTEPTMVRTWGTDYVIFRVNEPDFASVPCKKQFRVTVTSDGPVPTDHRIWVNYVTYSASVPELFANKQYAREVVTELGQVQGGAFSAQFTVDAFGKDTKAVLMTVTSMRDPGIPNESTVPGTLPKEFHYKVKYELLPGTEVPHQTTISTNTTWTPAMGPIYIRGALTIAANTTLSIEGGVVRIDPTAGFSGIFVEGNLTASGVRFESCSGDPWEYLAIVGAGSASLFNCDIVGASSGVVLLGSGAASLRRCRVVGGTDSGIWVNASGQVLVSDCRVTVPAVNYAEGIHIEAGSSSVVCSADTVICSQNQGVVGVKCGNSSTFEGVRVEGAVNGTGILLWGADSTVTAALDEHCRAKDCMRGVSVESFARPVIRNCKITGGSYGVYAGRETVPDLGRVMDYGNNSIYGTSSYRVFRVKNQIEGFPRVAAYGNFYGGEPVSSWFSPAVDYAPYLSGDPNLGWLGSKDGTSMGRVEQPSADQGGGVEIVLGENPFKTSTSFLVKVSAQSQSQFRMVEATVFDLSGRRILELGRMEVDEEGSLLEWSGRDEQGRSVCGGVYFLRVLTEEGATVAKLLKRE